MADLSNRTLSLFLVAAILVTAAGSIAIVSQYGTQGITGMVLSDTDTGKANFTISSNLSIRFNNAVIPFGSGSVLESATSCMMGTNNSPPSAAVGCVGFNTTVDTLNLTIENDGNIDVNVSINFTANATGFIGGTAPSLMYRVKNTEASSCTTIGNGSSFQEVTWNDMIPAMRRICTVFESTDSTDTIDIGIWMNIPETAATGARTVTINAMACDDNSC